MSLVPKLDTEARAKAQAAFPDGATVKSKWGGPPGVVIGHSTDGKVVYERSRMILSDKPQDLEVLP